MTSPPLARLFASLPRPAWLVLALTAAISVLPGYYAMFTGLAPWDDSGYLLLGLRQYGEGGILYDQLYTQYGPAYFQLIAGVFGVVGVELTHAVARGVVLVVWLAIAALCAGTTYRLTHSLSVALVVQVLVFRVLILSRDEPMHPCSILALSVAVMALAGSHLRAGRHPWAMGVIGALTAFAALTKVNVGLFALLATGFVLTFATRWPRAASPLRPAVALAVVATPGIYMLARIDEDWVWAYLIVVVCSLLAVVLVQSTTAVPALPVSGALVAAGACLVTAAVSLGLALTRGTSAHGLLRGVILDPLRTPNVFALPVPLASWAPGWALLSLVGAAAIVVLRGRDRWHGPVAATLEGTVQLLAGLAIWLVASGVVPVSPFSVSLPLLWLASMTRGEADGAIGRALLVMMAVMQALIVYPIAGSQVAWASFLFVPVGGLAVCAGGRQLREVFAPRLALVPATITRGATALGAGVVLTLAVHVGLYVPWQVFRSMYASSIPLGLHGAGLIRVPEPAADAYQRLVNHLAGRCRGFVTMPGLNSLYLFTRISAPTMLNTTSWMTLFSEAQQDRIRRQLVDAPGPLCAVRHTVLVDLWAQGQDVSGALLARYIDERFVTEFTVNGYEFMVERAGGPARN